MSDKRRKVATKHVYGFWELDKAKEACGNDWDKVRSLMGGKGANLGAMASLNLPVPHGFCVTTEACLDYLKNDDFPEGMWEQVKEALAETERRANQKFGDPSNPLLVSCRSGAKMSMPGMMETVLNIGLNDENVVAVGKLTNGRFAQDSYRRFIQGFGSVVLGISDDAFEDPLKEYKKKKGYKSDVDMKEEDWRQLVGTFKDVIKRESDMKFPQEPLEQLRHCIKAVFGSWNGKRAIAYRNRTGISHSLGTACNIVQMVFGNMGDDSATGVAFTRHPSTGENKLFGEYLPNAQGEDVVAGVRNANPVEEMEKDFPDAYHELLRVGKVLEQHFRNMQDVEFTVQNKKLWMLQTRDGKRTAPAQVKIALDMVEEKLIDKETAVKRVSADDVNILMLPQLDPKEIKKAEDEGRYIASGVNASPGGATGLAVFDADTADAWNKEGKKVILVRPFTKPEDVHGFFASQGIVTAEGGATSHAAVVARQFGVPCIAGAKELEIDLKKKQATIEGKNVVIKEGDTISLDATKGRVFLGEISTQAVDFTQNQGLQTILSWADEICARTYVRGPTDPMRGLEVWANADNGKDAARARKYGAHGIGLCRTEHMFFESDRLPIVQDMILAQSHDEREAALKKLLPHQRDDFTAIFQEMDGLPVIIRLLDPPLHEFLPEYPKLLTEVERLRSSGENSEEFKRKSHLLKAVDRLRESNPMMGLRGVRLGITVPEIAEMQVRAILEAADKVAGATGNKVKVEIMIPLTSHVNELNAMKKRCQEVAAKIADEAKHDIEYKFGTMIETPRAALTAGALAEVAEFFSCGTNDLTQMTFGISRDDAEREFLLEYVKQRILPANPFQTMDADGVGRLVDIACREGRQVRPDISVGICGEHGGDSDTIELCSNYGLNYVSCSPFRVPAARIAAAHAALKHKTA